MAGNVDRNRANFTHAFLVLHCRYACIENHVLRNDVLGVGRNPRVNQQVRKSGARISWYLRRRQDGGPKPFLCPKFILNNKKFSFFSLIDLFLINEFIL